MLTAQNLDLNEFAFEICHLPHPTMKQSPECPNHATVLLKAETNTARAQHTEGEKAAPDKYLGVASCTRPAAGRHRGAAGSHSPPGA